VGCRGVMVIIGGSVSCQCYLFRPLEEDLLLEELVFDDLVFDELLPDEPDEDDLEGGETLVGRVVLVGAVVDLLGLFDLDGEVVVLVGCVRVGV